MSGLRFLARAPVGFVDAREDLTAARPPEADMVIWLITKAQNEAEEEPENALEGIDLIYWADGVEVAS